MPGTKQVVNKQKASTNMYITQIAFDYRLQNK